MFFDFFFVCLFVFPTGRWVVQLNHLYWGRFTHSNSTYHIKYEIKMPVMYKTIEFFPLQIYLALQLILALNSDPKDYICFRKRLIYLQWEEKLFCWIFLCSLDALSESVLVICFLHVRSHMSLNDLALDPRRTPALYYMMHWELWLIGSIFAEFGESMCWNMLSTFWGMNFPLHVYFRNHMEL